MRAFMKNSRYKGEITIYTKMFARQGFLVYLMILLVTSILPVTLFLYAYAQTSQYIDTLYEQSNIPGMSVIVIQKGERHTFHFGRKNIHTEEQVDEYTLFELASNSKAFTALGILYLEKMGFIQLEDPIIKHIPSLYIAGSDNTMSNMANSISVKHLLHHTSGIPFSAFGGLPPDESKEALIYLEEHIKGYTLNTYPGEQFSYVSINYGLLGLIIQNITGEAFEDFIYDKVLQPLGLNHTYILPLDSDNMQFMAKGHKLFFTRLRSYDAPLYGGNLPAAYFVSNAKDMERWLGINLGIVEIPEFYKSLINKSHQTNTSVSSQNGLFYGFGWEADENGEYISHGGMNPNFSSMIILNPQRQSAVCVLANVNSTYTATMARSILNYIEGKLPEKAQGDIFILMDRLFTIAALILFLFSCLLVYSIIRSVIAISNKIKTKRKRSFIRIIITVVLTSLVICFNGGLFFLPTVLLGLSWSAIYVWMPISFIVAIVILFFFMIAAWTYMIIILHFAKAHGGIIK